MAAIGAITSVAMPHAAAPATSAGAVAPNAWMIAPASSASSTAAASSVKPSGIAGMDLSGDPLSDLVLRTYAADPLGLGSLDAAMDRVSANASFQPLDKSAPGQQQNPVPGSSLKINSSNAFAPGQDVAAMSTPDFIARSESSIASIYEAGVAASAQSGSARTGFITMATKLRDELHPPGGGPNVFDQKLMALEVSKQELTKKLKRGADDEKVILAQMLSLTIQQGMVMREKSKHEDLLNLLISLIIGVQVPKGCVERLVALGMGPVVRQLIEQMVGNGKGLSKSMQNQLRGLSDLGIDVHIVQERDSEVGMREAQRRQELLATIGGDGRLVAPNGRTVDANAVRGDLSDVLRRRAAGLTTTDVAGSQLATAGAAGSAISTGTAGATR